MLNKQAESVSLLPALPTLSFSLYSYSRRPDHRFVTQQMLKGNRLHRNSIYVNVWLAHSLSPKLGARRSVIIWFLKRTCMEFDQESQLLRYLISEGVLIEWKIRDLVLKSVNCGALNRITREWMKLKTADLIVT